MSTSLPNTNQADFDPNIPGPFEATQIVRRVRIPENLLFGPENQYSDLNIGATNGKLNYFAAQEPVKPRDSYVNAVIVSFSEDSAQAGAVAEIVVVELFTNPSQTSPLSSDVRFICSPASRIAVFPCFCHVYGVIVWAFNSNGHLYPSDVTTITNVLFT